MSYDEAINVIRVLEDASARFDYEKSAQYATQVKEFVRRSRKYCEENGLPLHSPFIRMTGHVGDLPQELLDAVLSVARLRNWPPACTTACLEYLRFLLSKDGLPDSQRNVANVYEPLFNLLVEGGDFYEHHGDICIRDAATVVLSKN